MKLLVTVFLVLFSITALLSQTDQNTELSADNPLYMEWVSENGFQFISEFKDGEFTLESFDVMDAEGNAIPEDVNKTTFDITKYDFNTIISPEKNIMIRITDGKAIFIKSKHRQAVLFKRHLINTSTNN